MAFSDIDADNKRKLIQEELALRLCDSFTLITVKIKEEKERKGTNGIKRCRLDPHNFPQKVASGWMWSFLTADPYQYIPFFTSNNNRHKRKKKIKHAESNASKVYLFGGIFWEISLFISGQDLVSLNSRPWICGYIMKFLALSKSNKLCVPVPVKFTNEPILFCLLNPSKNQSVTRALFFLVA